jgi:hypothetical protein
LDDQIGPADNPNIRALWVAFFFFFFFFFFSFQNLLFKMKAADIF